MKKATLSGHLAALLTVLIWGTTFTSTKVLLPFFTPIEILFFRFTIGYACLWVACPRTLKFESFKRELTLAAAGLCGVSLYFLLENIALTFTQASNVGVLVSISPFFIAILAHFFLKEEKLTRRFFVGLPLALAGIFLIGFNGNFLLKLNPIGDILAATAAFVWAVYSILMRKISAFGYHNILCTRRIFFYGLLFMLPALTVMDFTFGFGRFADPVCLLNILYLGVGACALCFVTWNWAVRSLGAVKTSMYIYLAPVISMVASAIVLGEKITALAVVGAVLILGGLYLSQAKPSEA